MATMYPHPLPRHVENDTRRAAERKVYEALEASLGPEHSVFYGVAWLARNRWSGARDGEVDFVVAHPERGVLLLEVKGGKRISRDQETGRWTSVDHLGYPHAIHDPFEQVRTSKHALLDKLKEHPVLGHERVTAGHGVVFPECGSPHHALAPDALPDITVFAEEMPHIGERVDRMFRYWKGQAAHEGKPSPKFLSAVTQLLAPSFELRQPLKAALDDEDRELLRLTEQQFHVLDMLKRARRVSITGGAGTGKTVLALEKAKRLAREGFDVLLTCFNRPLADHLRRSAGDIERLTILSFHQLCWQYAKRAGISLPEPGAVTPPAGFFEKDLPDAMLRALDYVGDRFDAIVVDEGQDFLESWWVPLECCFSDTADGILYVFHDDNQQVYHRVPTFPAELQEMVLDENLRNTQRIHEATSRFYRGEPFHAVGPEGREVEIIPVASQDEIGAEVGKVLHRLIAKEHLTASDIAVLVGASHGSPFKKEDQIGNVAVTRDQTTEPGKVLLESVRRFKGLERKVVVLTGIDDLAPEDEKSLLYVGLSRARVYLVVVATAATLGRLGLGAAVAPG